MKCPGHNVLNSSCKWTGGQAKMLIMSSLKCKETEQTFHVPLSPSEKAMKISDPFLNPWDRRL